MSGWSPDWASGWAPAGPRLRCRTGFRRLDQPRSILVTHLDHIGRAGGAAVVVGATIVVLTRVAAILATVRPTTLLAAMLATLMVVATIAIAAGIAALAALITLLCLALFLFARHFPRRLAQHPGIVFRILKKALLGHAVIAKLGVASEPLVLVDDLLRRAANLAFRA